MTVEYILLLVTVFAIGLKFFTSAPMDAFREGAPKLGARIEKNMETGGNFQVYGKGTKSASDWAGGQ